MTVYDSSTALQYDSILRYIKNALRPCRAQIELLILIGLYAESGVEFVTAAHACCLPTFPSTYPWAQTPLSSVIAFDGAFASPVLVPL